MDADPWAQFDDVDAAAAAIGSDKPPLVVYADEVDEPSESAPKRDWKRFRVPAALIFGTAVVSAAGLLIARVGNSDADTAHVSTQTETVTAAPAPMSAPPEGPTTAAEPFKVDAALETAAEHKTLSDADTAYLAALDHVGLAVKDPALAIAAGRGVCGFLADGHTAVEAVRSAMQLEPSLDVMTAARFVVAAVNAYCPQFSKEIQ